VILGYHGIGTASPAQDPHGLLMPASAFLTQVRDLQRRGYRFVRQSHFAAALRTGSPMGAIASLTFDDGMENNVTALLPLLCELDVPATLYICPGLLGAPCAWLDPELGARTMTEEQLVQIADDPLIEVGSHTMRHTSLARAGAEKAHAEMLESRLWLEDRLQRPVLSFAYPHGHYSPDCLTAAARAGYTSAVTAGDRGGSGPFELRRETPRPADSLVLFRLRTSGWRRRLKSLSSPLLRGAHLRRSAVR
jgi:peptidoglycan/xylan/chitin deacetylase (PgdA/CDA1 family)